MEGDFPLLLLKKGNWANLLQCVATTTVDVSTGCYRKNWARLQMCAATTGWANKWASWKNWKNIKTGLVTFVCGFNWIWQQPRNECNYTGYGTQNICHIPDPIVLLVYYLYSNIFCHLGDKARMEAALDFFPMSLPSPHSRYYRQSL